MVLKIVLIFHFSFKMSQFRWNLIRTRKCLLNYFQRRRITFYQEVLAVRLYFLSLNWIRNHESKIWIKKFHASLIACLLVITFVTWIKIYFLQCFFLLCMISSLAFLWGWLSCQYFLFIRNLVCRLLLSECKGRRKIEQNQIQFDVLVE